MDYFPAFMDLRGRKAVVIGGGAVAARKAAMLERAGAVVTIVADELFMDDHLDGSVLAIAASDNRDLCERVARHSRRRGIPVNVVDDAELSTFIMPAIIDRAPVTVAISTGGASPVLARWVRGRIECALPTRLGRLATLAGRMRRAVKKQIPNFQTRRRFWEQALDGPAADFALAGLDDAADAVLHRAMTETDREEGQVWLVGAGPGDPELLTIKALRALQSADVIVHDRLASRDVLVLARRDADQVCVGEQADIGELLIGLARDGKRVVRITDRSGEEIDALIEAGVVCHVIPGVTAEANQQPTQLIETENAA